MPPSLPGEERPLPVGNLKNCIYIENFPLIHDLLADTLRADKDFITAPERPGHGMLWDSVKLDRYRVR